MQKSGTARLVFYETTHVKYPKALTAKMNGKIAVVKPKKEEPCE